MTGLAIASATCTIIGGACGIANSLIENKKQEVNQAKMCEDIAYKVKDLISPEDNND